MKKPEKKNIPKAEFPSLPKSVEKFLLEEEGKITTSQALKIGIGLGVLSGLLADFDDVSAHGDSNPHTNSVSTTAHTSHANHGDNHNSGGWC